MAVSVIVVGLVAVVAITIRTVLTDGYSRRPYRAGHDSRFPDGDPYGRFRDQA